MTSIAKDDMHKKRINWINGVKVVGTRSLLLYAMVVVLMTQLVSPDRARAKILNNLRIPIDYIVLYSRGDAEFDSDMFSRHLEYYQAYGEYLPESPEAQGLLGFCYYSLGDTGTAILHLKKAIKIHKGFFWSHYNLGAIYFNEGLHEEAIASFQKALSTSPELSRYFISQSRILGNVEDRDIIGKKIGIKRRNLLYTIDTNIHNGFKNAYEYIVRSYYLMGKYENVISYANKGVEANFPASSVLYLYSGMSLYRLDRFPEAIRALRASATDANMKDRAHYYLSLCLEKLSEDRLSQEMMEKEKRADFKGGEFLNQKISLIVY